MTMPDDVDFSISQFSGAWRVMCSSSPDFVTDRNRDVEYIFSDVPVPFFNMALVTARGISQRTLETLARDATKWAAGRPVPWMLLVTHDALAPGVDASSVLDACGFTPLLPMTGM